MTVPEPGIAPASPSAGRWEVPLAALAASAALSAAFLVPIVGVLGVPVAAVPIVRLAHRQGLAAALTACGLAAAASLGLGWAGGSLGGGVAIALLTLAVTVLPAASVGFVRAGADPSRCYVGLCLAGCVLLAACFAVSGSGPGAPLPAEVGASFDRIIPAAVESYAHSGADADAVARMRQTLEAARDFAKACLWGIFGALWVLGGAIAFYGGAAAARPAETAEASRFEALRIPAAAAGVFVAAGAVFGLLSGEGRRLSGNLLLPLVALYFVAGLSIICHFFRKWFRVRILRIGLYTLASYFPINLGVALLGLFDWYMDFRRRGEGVIEKS
ncbi:MAG TPA: DUF2232 domain-containing protein [Thermoanaerobaculia bacterium]|nr:DUF2232 domain-containing protein [Thermoanaerobaculia bacterium]